MRSLGVVAQAQRTLDCLGDIGDGAIVPAAQFVSEDSEAPRPAASDGALGDNAALRAIAVSNRCRLDHEPPLRHPHVER